ncbi:RNAse P Rpr2/Rpp21/SNM1 subunit domain-containing protein, partial [Phycomyces nitens]
MTTNQQITRLGFLFDASHKVFAECPSLSRFYMSEFQHTLDNYETKTAQAVDRISCPRCGQIYAPGFNSTVRLEAKKPTKKKKQKPNRLVYQCNACTFRHIVGGSQKNNIPTFQPTVPTVSTIPTIPTISTVPTITKIMPQVATSAKKKKNNALQAMLAKSKQKTGPS